MSGTDDSEFSLFLENSQAMDRGVAAYVYEAPVDMVSVCDARDLAGAFERLEEALAAGFHLAGWISYEAGLALEPRLCARLPEATALPYIHMGIFKERRTLNAQDAGEYWRAAEERDVHELKNIRLNMGHKAYGEAFDKIQAYLRAGDIYQVNFTLKALFDFAGSRESFYATLRRAQRVEYSAFMEMAGGQTLLSLSPELFIRKQGQKLTTKPMKGTIRRGRDIFEDEKLAVELKSSEKERAENLMIVDLLRNDLSRVASPGSVKVESLYDVERYRTLLTMTSTITADIRQDVGPLEVLKTLFPCGSVTGAPKIRAMEIIDEIEARERGVYTGAIGFITPGGDMCFNVPIRTLLIDKEGRGEMGVGGAIVADSTASSEYDECLLKTSFLTLSHPEFDLIEALKWQGKFDFLEDHLNRLENSADYFDFRFDRAALQEELLDHSAYLDDKSSWKVRVLLSRRGHTSITSIKIMEDDRKKTVVIASEAVKSDDVLLYHKTTSRDFFTRQYQHYKAKNDCYDVLFTNEKGELTEGSFNNLLIKKDGVFYTPPVTCGLLGGIFRNSLLKGGKIKTVEKILIQHDLEQADEIYMANAVRGLVKVELVT